MSDLNPPVPPHDRNGLPVTGAEPVGLPDEIIETEPRAGAGQLDRLSQPGLLQALAGLGGLGALAWLLARLRRRRRPTPSERLTEAAQAVGTASFALGGRVADRAVAAAAPVGDRAGDVTRRGAQAGAELAQRTVATAAPVLVAAAQTASREGRQVASLATEGVTELVERAGDLGSKVAQAGKGVTSTIAEVPETIAEGGDLLQRKWRKLMSRMTMLIAGGAGYVLGARAGRDRYEQMTRAAAKVAQRPEVQQAKDKLRGFPPQRSGSGGAGTSSAGDHADPVTAPSIPTVPATGQAGAGPVPLS